jgi:internalin A
VLNPHWVTEGVYGILNHPALTAEQAELRATDLRGMLDRARFPPERHDFLLQLMRRFELAVPFPEKSDLYLVPERLSPEQPADIGAFDAAHCLTFAYDYPTLLPEGLLPRFIVRTHILSTGCPRWRSGVVLQLEGNRALVIGDAINHRVSITIDGPVAGRRRVLAVIRYDLEHIHRSYQFQPQAIVPVPGHPEVVVPYDKLLRFERDGVPAFPEVVEDRTTMLDVRQLLDGVDLAPPKHADAAARRETQPTTAFISYAHKDEPLRQELDTHLKLLQVTGELDAWHDRSITAGEKWEGQINDNLRRADIVLLLLSPDFIASDYCRKEMEIALQREATGQARVVPIIVRPCGWRHLPVQANQALPTDGKPVADAGHEQGHRDAAWIQVEDGIRRVLKALACRSS